MNLSLWLRVQGWRGGQTHGLWEISRYGPRPGTEASPRAGAWPSRDVATATDPRLPGGPRREKRGGYTSVQTKRASRSVRGVRHGREGRRGGPADVHPHAAPPTSFCGLEPPASSCLSGCALRLLRTEARGTGPFDSPAPSTVLGSARRAAFSDQCHFTALRVLEQ